ncbi:hypothetical protein [Streptomyces sp. NPDC060194]|uniref:hypothetical protein n=1 Tax=Streptomyces sp. NPDC060194 TaxID=3347069 RepID=UPI0036579EF2
MSAHRTTTTETGSFVTAICACGWRGPSRRARSKAREDAAAHERENAVPAGA